MTVARSIRQEARRIVGDFAPLYQAALDVPNPAPELVKALERIDADPMLRYLLGETCES